MTDERDTPLEASGIENVEPQEDDTPEDDLTYYDPDDDDPDTVEGEEAEGIEDEDSEAEDTPEEESEDEQDQQPEPVEAREDAKVRLPDGTETTVAELVKGYNRQSDYTRKTMDLKKERDAVSEKATQIESISQAFIDHLANLLPDEPSEDLIHSDFQKYARQKAIYDRAKAQVEKLIEIGQKPKEVRDQLSAEDRQAQANEEFQKLLTSEPEIKSQPKLDEYRQKAAEGARHFGYSDDELAGVTDHRLIRLAHYAQIGREALQAKQKGKAKVAETAVRTPRQKPGEPGRKRNDNREAMRRLGKSGSLRDALNVDFD